MGRIQKIVVQKLSLLPETDSIQKIVRHTHKQRERESKRQTREAGRQMTDRQLSIFKQNTTWDKYWYVLVVFLEYQKHLLNVC